MNEILELRCLLEQGKLIQQMMTITMILMGVEVGICVTALARWINR